MFCEVITCELSPRSWLLSAINILVMKNQLCRQSEHSSFWIKACRSVLLHFILNYNVFTVKSDRLDSAGVIDLVYSPSTR